MSKKDLDLINSAARKTQCIDKRFRLVPFHQELSTGKYVAFLDYDPGNGKQMSCTAVTINPGEVARNHGKALVRLVLARIALANLELLDFIGEPQP